jgi:cation transport regulator ChaC
VGRREVISVTLDADEHALVGYGSLLSVASMERTLGRTYNGPWHLCRLNGWRRGWDVQMPKHRSTYRDGDRVITPARVLYLNLRPQHDSHVNVALFVITTEELQRFDEREWIYGRQNVNADLADVHVSGGTAWTYVALDKYLWRQRSRPPEAIIRRTYLDILDRAHQELGDEFRHEYDATTDAAPPQLIVDDIVN